MLIDTHAHIYLPKFDKDREAVMKRAAEASVHKIFLPNVDSTTIPAMLALEADYPGRCFAMMGLHPCSVKENVSEELEIVKSWLDKRPFCAVGEIGIDLYWDKTFFVQQTDAFKKQIEWAIDLDIPIVIHSRESTDIVIEILTEMKHPKLRGIFHCFSGNAVQARKVVDQGFHLGIGGVLTYKKSTLPDAIKDIPLEWLVLETDSPYLPPVPFRGKRNESAYIHQIGDYLASVKQLPFKEIATQTTKNAQRIFDKPEK